MDIQAEVRPKAPENFLTGEGKDLKQKLLFLVE